MTFLRYFVVPAALCTVLAACGDRGDSDGTGGVATGGTGTGGEVISTGGLSGTGATTASGGASGGTTSSGGTGEEIYSVAELLVDAEEDCLLDYIDATIQYADEDFSIGIESRITDLESTLVSGQEVLKMTSNLGHDIDLSWADTAQDGEQVPTSGFLLHARTAGDVYRCFDGEVIVRLTPGSNAYFVFASNTVYEATADGTCGALIPEEIFFGCISERH